MQLILPLENLVSKHISRVFPHCQALLVCSFCV